MKWIALTPDQRMEFNAPMPAFKENEMTQHDHDLYDPILAPTNEAETVALLDRALRIFDSINLLLDDLYARCDATVSKA